jgi:hypothetical protein
MYGNYPFGRQEKPESDGLIRFVVAVSGTRGSTLWVEQFVTSNVPYEVKKIVYSPNRDRAQRLGKLTAEKFAESLRKWNRAPRWVKVEPEVFCEEALEG